MRSGRAPGYKGRRGGAGRAQSRTERSRADPSRQRPTMATSEPTPAQPKAEEQQNIGTRVANLPLVSSAYDMVSSAYTCTKESHPYVRSVCDVAEKGVKTLTAAAVSGAQPLLTRLEPQISSANEFACKGLDKLEEKLPILQQPPQKIISDTKLLVTSTVTGARDVLTSTVAGARDAVSNTMAGARDAVSGTVAGAKDAVSSTVSGARDAVSSTVSGARDAVSSTVAGARDAVSSTVTGAKDAVTSRVTGVMDMTKGAVQGGVEMTRSAVSSGVSTVGQMVASRVDSMLGKSEELVDHYLPLTDGELAQLATAVEGFEPEQQRQQQSYFVRLGSLSSKVRQRALQHSLSKLQSARQSCQDQLAQLQRTLDLVETLKQGVDQKLQGGQEKLQQLWLEWSKKQPDGGKDQVPPEAVESGTVSMLQGLSQQLQSSCQPLVCSLQGLPAAVQDKAGQVRHNVEGLRAALGSVRSLQDVTGPVLARARDHAAQARLLMDELVEQVAFNTPLTWLVGPFAPSGKRPVEPEAE
uniref:Perilipin n=1 Tax=Junco hyemalis TaxID=40217 RepID=A0A8C5IV41_JUNHY